VIPVRRRLGLMLVALLLAGLVWYGNARDRRERISERQIEAPVILVNKPAEMVITSEVPRSLTLRLRGPLKRLRELTAEQVGVVLDLRGASEGVSDIPVETRNVVTPSTIEVVAASPSQVPLKLERLVHKKLPIRPRLVGEPSAGRSVGSVVAEPSMALVTGPKDLVEKLQAVATDPVSLDGTDGPVETLVAVRSPHPLIWIVEPLAVRVVVSLQTRVEPRAGRVP
jgi:YbbR domain-containing protein